MAIQIDLGSTYGLYSYAKLRKAIENMKAFGLKDKQIQDILDNAHAKDEEGIETLKNYSEYSDEFIKRLITEKKWNE